MDLQHISAVVDAGLVLHCDSKDTHNVDNTQLGFRKPDLYSYPYPRPSTWLYILGFNIVTSKRTDRMHCFVET